MNKLTMPIKFANKNPGSIKFPFEPEQLYKSDYSANAPNILPLKYICGNYEEDDGQRQEQYENFFRFVYGKEAKSAAGYYGKSRLSAEYLKKNTLKKLSSPFLQLSFSTSMTRMSAAMCVASLGNPTALSLNYHVRCIVNFATCSLGKSALTLSELFQHHQNDDFRSTARRLRHKDAKISDDLLITPLFGVLAYWGLNAYQLLTSDNSDVPPKTTQHAVLCWHAIAYLYNSRALVLAGKTFPAHNGVDYIDSVTSPERDEDDYDGFYEKPLCHKLQAALTQKDIPEERQVSEDIGDISRRIKEVSAFFIKESGIKESGDIGGDSFEITLTETGETLVGKGEEALAFAECKLEAESHIRIDLCQQPMATLSNLRQLSDDESYTQALSKWSEIMTPEALAQQRGEITRAAFQLVPTLLASLSQNLLEIANRFEIAKLGFDLPQPFQHKALQRIDYNRLYLDVHEILPRLHCSHSALDELEQIVGNIDKLNQDYCNHSLAPGEMPPPSVIRVLGATSLEIEEQMSRLAEQWPVLVDEILVEHNSALKLYAESNVDGEANDAVLLAQVEQQKHQLVMVQAELNDAREANYKLSRERDQLKLKDVQGNAFHIPGCVSFETITQLLKQKVSYLDILNLADELYVDRLVVLDSARSAAKELGAGADHLYTMARQLRHLVEEYLPAILASQPDAQARKCFSTNVYSAMESATVTGAANMAAQRTFTYNGEEHFFRQHLRIGKNIRIHFILDKDNRCVVIGHCGAHLRTQKTANQ